MWMGEGSWVGSRVLGEYMIAPEKLFVCYGSCGNRISSKYYGRG